MHVVHLQHRTGVCSAMHGVQHNDHHHPASAAYGVQDCGYTLQTIAAGSEDRAGDGDTLQGAGHVADKLRMSSGRGKDAQSVHSEALSFHWDPLMQESHLLESRI